MGESGTGTGPRTMGTLSTGGGGGDEGLWAGGNARVIPGRQEYEQLQSTRMVLGGFEKR